MTFNPRSEESKRLFERIERMLMKGMEIKDIAQKLGVSHGSVAYRVNKLIHTGRIPYSTERKHKTSVNLSVLRYRYGTRAGSMSNMLRLLTLDELHWLITTTPKDATLAEAIAALIKDAYAEDNDDD